MILNDRNQRERFCNNIHENFSVVAPAGVGKTTAIVNRITTIALREPQMLPTLVAITYTKKSAEEMRERTLHKLFQSNVLQSTLQLFEDSFFGTIHSFCLSLVQKQSLWLGLSPNPNVSTDVQTTWLWALRNLETFRNELPKSLSETFFRHVELSQILSLVTITPPTLSAANPLSKPPQINGSALLNFVADKRNQVKVEEGKQLFQKWMQDVGDSAVTHLPLPEYAYGGEAFKSLWQNTFQPLKEWLELVTLTLVAQLSKQFFQFRMQKNCIFYDDMSLLVNEMLAIPEIAQNIHKMNYRILLDEAQDTDPEQLKCLLAIASQVEKLSKNTVFAPKKGHFCMVGDAQQAIYGSRASVDVYWNLHQQLQANQDVTGVEFNVTLRCPKALIKGVNTLFPNIFQRKSKTPKQIPFVPLQAPDVASEGVIVRKQIVCHENENPINAEIQWLTDWMKGKTPAHFGVEKWSNIAFLCPYNDWLVAIAKSFQSQGIPTQLHSSKTLHADSRTFSWFIALVKMIAQPLNAFEIAGVLREIFGISDLEIANFVSNSLKNAQNNAKINLQTENVVVKEQNTSENRNSTHPLQILADQTDSSQLVARHLTHLKYLRDKFLRMPLFDSVTFLMEFTQLRERLLLLPNNSPDSPKEIDFELDEFLTKAIQLEQDNKHVDALLTFLEEQKDKTIEAAKPDPNALQFYSCHKAKGMEWPVVVLPLLFRPLIFPHTQYPTLVTSSDSTDVKVAFDKSSASSLLTSSKQAEFERLLYVSMTRVKNALILIDDASLFCGKRSGAFSFGELLNLDHSKHTQDWWQSLPENLPTELEQNQTQVFAEQADPTHQKNPTPTPLPHPPHDFLAQVAAIAKAHPKKVVPSKSVASQEFSSSPSTPSLGTDYGLWWHAMMQAVLMKKRDCWPKSFHDFIASCPSPNHGTHEIELFLRSNLYKTLQDQSWILQTEVPILGMIDDSTCIEGVLDLLVHNPKTLETIIVDWKTERISDINTLIATYPPQLQLYKSFARKHFPTPTKTLLYSTQWGVDVEVG